MKSKRLQLAMNRRNRRGSILLYTIILMTVFLALISFSVDYGHIQSVKAEMQRSADAIARGTLQTYARNNNNVGYGNYAGYYMQVYNPVDPNSNTSATVTTTWGSWDNVNQVFIAGSSAHPVAVQTRISRTAAAGNPVNLTFPLMNGKAALRRSVDVWAVATAVCFDSQSVNATVNGTMDPWLAGMPNGSTASDTDTAPAQSPPVVLNVVPGTTITFTNVSGAVKYDPSNQTDNANGGWMITHMQDSMYGNYDGNQNGIATVTAPIDSMMGLFLTKDQPNTTAYPSARDYSSSASRDKAAYTDIQPKQPFYIGTGKTSGGTTMTFLVPPGATRLYLGTMDGHQWSNNSGSYSTTVSQSSMIQMVQ